MVAAMDDLFQSGVSDLVDRAAKARARAIEVAVEKALQGGKFGVIVDDVRCIAYAHPSVPYGQMYVLSRIGEGDVNGWLLNERAARAA